MARKSRKNSSDVCLISPSVQTFKTAIYARLSIENSGKDDDGDSIENQISYCKAYVEERPYLELVEIFEDNGRKGTNFDRLAFNKMMDKIRAGKINAIVCKDLSRFARDYVEAGNYLEKIFPFMGVRFIAITDNFDSFETDGSEEALMIPLKNMINQLYAKDISRKIITSFRARQEKGEFLPGFIPYGYVKSKTVQYGIEVDEAVADNIRNIFKWKIEGVTHKEISRRLEASGATTPAKRKFELGIWHDEKYLHTSWYGRTIIDILKNRTYTGDLVYGKMPKSYYEGIKMHRASPDEWRIIPDHHEAIVDRDTYDTVQRIFAESAKDYHERMDKNKAKREAIVNIYQDKFYCGNCGKKMRFKKEFDNRRLDSYFNCGGFVDSSFRNCSRHYITYGEINGMVYEQIKAEIDFALDVEKLLEQLKGSEKERNLMDQYQGEINSISMKLRKLSCKRESLYENYCEGILDNDEYLYAKKEYDDEYDRLSGLLEEVRLKKVNVTDVLKGNNKWFSAISKIRDIDSLDQKLVDELIDSIRYFDGEKGKYIEIVMKYGDERKKMLEILSEITKEV